VARPGIVPAGCSKVSLLSPQPWRVETRIPRTRPQQVNNDGHSELACIRCPRMARMSLPLRASNEGLLRPRVARAQGTHRAIPSPAGGLFQHSVRRAAHLSTRVYPSQGNMESTHRLRGVEPCVIQIGTRRGRAHRSASTFYNLERLWRQAVRKIVKRERSIERMSHGSKHWRSLGGAR
jgi:hypothetical protein